MKAIYIRTSTDEQNPENQMKDCLTLIEGSYAVYQDKQSAWKDNKEREGFEQVLEGIRAGKINELYVWDWDRIYRNRKRLKEFFQFAAMHKCRIHSFRQAFFENFYKIPSPFDEIMQELFLNLLGWMAEDESTKKSQRVKIAVRKEEGVTKSYKGNKWGRAEVAPEVKEQVLRLAAEGKPIRQIAQEVYYYDKYRNRKQVSKSLVHKLLQQNKP